MTPEWHEKVALLYRAALELEPARRAAYLAEACRGDESLRQEVESLLRSETRRGGLIDQPALEAATRTVADDQIGSPTRSSIGQTVGHCRILSRLGKGGMGEVWLAEDARLGRKVAVKLLPAEFTAQPERVRRFAQEARAASALNHPNIITIHEIGEAPAQSGSIHYIVTEYVEGDTLGQRMTKARRNRMQIAEAVDVAAQVAAALAAAHEAGITHRDIKPENVMVRRDGLVKVLDFGLAKLTEPATLAVDTQAPTAPGGGTESGVVIGTPRYMSPEQARGEKVDARTDIFSLGVMLYEMIAGRAPFVRATTSEMIAAILRDAPLPLTSHAPDTPQELERISGKALRKNREERYQTATDLLIDLKQLQRDLEFASEEKKRSGQPKAEGGAPQKRRLVAIAALAALIIAALVVWLYFNRAPVLTSQDTILLADFENKTGEEIFDGMLKQALAIQLQQTPFLNLFPEARVRHELTLMRRQPNERVTAELAREICERQNIKAFIDGSIAPLASHYVITLEAANGQSGETLARALAQAEGKEQVLRALSQAATELRGKLGESLSSIQRFDRSLQEGTTDKPKAFKAYSQAIELAVSGRLVEAIPFYQRAVELDPEFAHAYSQLAIMYSVSGQPERAVEYAKKSYELKDRAGEIEKFRIIETYHRVVTGDLNKTIEALRMHRRTYPREYVGPTDLARNYILLGQYDQAIAEARESIRLNPNFAGPYAYVAVGVLRLNRFAEAKDILAQALRQNLDNPIFRPYLFQIAFINNDPAGMRQQLDWARGGPHEHMAWDWQTQAAAFAGQWRKAQELSRRAIDVTARGDMREVAGRYATEQALRGAVFGDCRQATTDIREGLNFARGRIPLTRSALALALCGEANQARPLTDELSRLYPEDTLCNELWLPLIRAASALQQSKAALAIEQLQPASRYEAAAEFWPAYLRGQAYLKLGRGAEAVAEFQKILDHRGYAPLSPLYSLAHLGRARAAALTGDAASSRKGYEDFFAAWKDADADQPILSEARREHEKR